MPKLSKAQEDRIKKMILAKVRPLEIIRAEDITFTPIYRLMDELGIPHKRYTGYNVTKSNSVALKDNFVCQGIGHCGSCPRPFQPPCPMAIMEGHYEYDGREAVISDFG